MVIGEVFFIERGFFQKCVTMEDVSGDGKEPMERERLTILQMVGEIEEDMSLSRVAGIWLRSQYEFVHSVITMEMSVTEVGEKESRLGGIVVVGKCGAMREGADRS